MYASCRTGVGGGGGSVGDGGDGGGGALAHPDL